MELSPTNFFRSVFQFDNLSAGVLGIYEAEIGMPRIIVDHLSTHEDEIRLHEFGDHILMEPFDMLTEKRFNLFATLAICEAHKIFNQRAENVYDAFSLLGRYGIPSGPTMPDPHRLNDYFVLPDQEFLGIIACRQLYTKQFEPHHRYSIAVLNPRAIVKVTHSPSRFCEPHLGPL